MSLVVVLVLGGFVGWIAAAITEKEEGIFASIIIGMVGATLGGLTAALFTSGDHAMMESSWGDLFWSFVGAALLVAIVNIVRGARRDNAEPM